MLPAAVILSLKLVEDKIEQLTNMRKFSVANSPQFDVEISFLLSVRLMSIEFKWWLKLGYKPVFEVLYLQNEGIFLGQLVDVV